MFRRGINTAILLLWAAAGQASDGWCVYTDDIVGDGKLSTYEFNLQAATEAIYVSYDAPDAARVFIEIEDAAAEVTLNSQQLWGGCANTLAFKAIEPLPAGKLLRLRVAVEPRLGFELNSDIQRVSFYTPSGNECAQDCEGGH